MDNYDTETKNEARTVIVDHILAHRDRFGTHLKILTLPSKYGYCARDFRNSLDDFDIEIIGLEREKQIVRQADLVDDGIIDRFFCGHLQDFCNDQKFIQEIVLRKSRIDTSHGAKLKPHLVQVRGEVELNFDIMFLDYTGRPSADKFQAVDILLERNPKGIVAVTFSLTGDDYDVVKDKYPPETNVHFRYSNGASDMILVMVNT